EIAAGDTIMVSRAGIVYVIGEVNRAGGFVMENSGSMTVAQALAKAAGPTGMASLNDTKIIRRTPQGLQNIDLEAKKILEAKIPDVPLQAEDILYVPNSKSKALLNRSSNSIFLLLTGLALSR
ncbi:MAG: polysaccharide biosynthesis/export family protein, partial [Candidatus Korobacteraceae bacterium]